MRRCWWLVPLSLFAVVLCAARARADPWFGWGENALEDAYLEGDIDSDDRLGQRVVARSIAHGADVHGESWVSLGGFAEQLRSGRNDVGGFVVIGLALDRMAEGPVRPIAEPPADPAPPSPTAGGPASPTPHVELRPPPTDSPLPAPALARPCVAAALRSAGLGVDDARLDNLVKRARASAWLPETRMRAMRLWDDAIHTTTVTSTDTANYYDAIGANLVLELRVTWRLDRLLYAGDETTIERLKIERQYARARIAARTLEALFAWQRATLTTHTAASGSSEQTDARLRAAETRAVLDVMTAGWFSRHARLGPRESSKHVFQGAEGSQGSQMGPPEDADPP